MVISDPPFPATTWTWASDRPKLAITRCTWSAVTPVRSGYFSCAPPLKSIE